MHRNTVREVAENRARLFPGLPSDSTRGKKHKLGHRRPLLNQGALCYSEGDQVLQQVESPP